MAEEIKILNIDIAAEVKPGTIVYGVTPEGLDVTHTMAQIAEANFLQNGIVTIGSTFLDEGLRTYTFGGWQWRINGVVKTPALFETDAIPTEASGESRAYIVVGKEDSTFQVIAGDATTDLPIDPPTPPGTIYLTRFVSSGAVIGELEEPIVGSDDYKKIYLAEQRITEEVLEVTLPEDGRTNFIFTVGGFDMQGFVVPEGYEHLFAGKLFFLYNASDDPITLLFDEGTADILFNFKDAADFILEPDTKVIFQYSPNYDLQLVSGGSSSTSPTIEKVFTVSLAMIGASDITDVDDVRTKLRAYTIAEGLTKPANETHNWEVVESLIPTIPTLVFVTDDASAFATDCGITDINDVADWNTFTSGTFDLFGADFATVNVDVNTITLSGGTGAIVSLVVIAKSNLISFACYNLETLDSLNVISTGSVTSIDNVLNCPLINDIQLDGNLLTVASLDAGLLDWATNEATTGGYLNITSNAEDLTTSDTYAMLVTTKSWTT